MLGIALVKKPVHKYAVMFPSKGEGDNYDYSAIKYLSKIWTSPYSYWDLEIQIKYKPHSNFASLSEDDMCPCGSERSYKECCIKNPQGVRYNHYVILYNKI